ncbi:hypothetical protein LUZ63_010321 [Rhynchospora breviuscula]|uniref:Helitron helicase-like domain-containing protein n=1 Tax=Rhynchospora breviuscula TaxID=2022672 RepID=A0A9Q0CGS5_9POAL|nr:hypothetical protein LUZ63_010321 [Rhynchospora breviuscula]
MPLDAGSQSAHTSLHRRVYVIYGTPYGFSLNNLFPFFKLLTAFYWLSVSPFSSQFRSVSILPFFYANDGMCFCGSCLWRSVPLLLFGHILSSSSRLGISTFCAGSSPASGSRGGRMSRASLLSSCESVNPYFLDFGDPDQICPDCNAYYWSREASKSTDGIPVYTLCCREGRVKLNLLEEHPKPLRSLLDPSSGPDSIHFINSLRVYNSMFAFTSMGARIDSQINRAPGPYVFRVSGQVCHRMGSLLPAEGQRPTYAQLYMYDTANEVQNRMTLFPGSAGSPAPREHIVSQVAEMLYQHNPIAQGFRSVRDRLGSDNASDFQIHIASSRAGAGLQYSVPVAEEVVGLVVGDFDQQHSTRDIVIKGRDGHLERINPLHKKYFALQYPLVFSRGQDSFTEDIEYDSTASGASGVCRPHITMAEYYRFRLHVRYGEPPVIFRSGKLCQQVCVDFYACIENARLDYLYNNQDSLRADSVQNIRTAVLEGDMFGHQVGKRVVLPASFVGAPRYLFQNYQDALALCRHLGPPHLFVTFTCNPAWPEITRNLMQHQTAADRPDLTCRVFKMKLKQMIRDIRKRKWFGPVTGLIYVVEFQKRGLPHVHIVIWLADKNSLNDGNVVDSVISAELPDPNTDPLGYAVVGKFMLHGPCGQSRPNSPCMEEGRCKKYFPKEYAGSTLIAHDDFVRYRRRNLGVSFDKNGCLLDNRFVVPYNLRLLLRYEAHINVEGCHSTSMIKYLFKYICKGHDCAVVVVQPSSHTAPPVPQQQQTAQTAVDEIKHYLDCRYLTPPEAVWRIFQSEIHHSNPSVERLPVHLPCQNNVIFRDDQDLNEIANSDAFSITKLMAWFELNKTDDLARELTYPDITKKFTWNQRGKFWKKRKQGRHLARMLFVHPGTGELYYLRMLLNIVRGCTCFEDIRTVNGMLYPTFKDACNTAGLLDNDAEWLYTLEEAAVTASSRHIRGLFVDMLLFSEVSDPDQLWDACWHLMGDDILHTLRTQCRLPEFTCSDAVLKDNILYVLEELLLSRGSSLEDAGLPQPTEHRIYEISNRLLAQQLSYNTIELREQAPVLFSTLNNEQKDVM